jgi:arylsulfatase A-like enzyme
MDDGLYTKPGLERARLALALALGAVAGEAMAATSAAAGAGLSGAHALLSGVLCGLLLLVPGAPLGIGAALFVGWGAFGALTHAARQALGGPEASGAVALASLGACLGLVVLMGMPVSEALFDAMSARFAAFSTNAAILALALLVLPLGIPLGRALAFGGARLGRAPLAARLMRPWLGALLLAALLLTLGARLLPLRYLAAPVTALLALSVALAWRVRAPRARHLGWVIAPPLLLLVLALPSVVLIEAAPAPVQDVLLYRTPFLSLALGGAHRALDRDGDGYSPFLVGGDCDDRDPKVHFGAPDVPGNGVDENCSGRDARRYRPAPPPTASAPAAAPMNHVLILIDALRADHLSHAGYARPTTPNIDRFRDQATWFKYAYTPSPTTRFAMGSLFTGLHPLRLPHKPGRGNRFRLLSKADTVAERLAKAGYDRVGYSISYVVQHNKGTGQGFRLWKTPWPDKDWKKVRGEAAPITNEAALKFLKQKRNTDEKPFHLFLHYRCTHDPYVKHDEWDYGDRDVDRYDSALNYCDQHIGALLEALAARDDYDRTVVALFADHGELFGDHGLTNHGNSLFEADVRVPLLLRVPGHARRTVEVPVSLADLAPTLLETAGIEAPQGLDGWSLLPLLSEGADEGPWRARPLFLYTDVKRGSAHYLSAGVLRWPLKAIRDLKTGHRALYDVRADPGEIRDLSVSMGARLDQLDEEIESILGARY